MLAFIQQFNYQTTEIKTNLASAISILVANQIKISFKSNNGVFYPIIRNKDITGVRIPSIFIAYEKINNEENTGSLASNRTVITLNPVDYSIIDELKFNFSFLYSWTKILQTKYGMVLIGNNQTNNFFLNGKKVVIHILMKMMINNTYQLKWCILFFVMIAIKMHLTLQSLLINMKQAKTNMNPLIRF